MPNKLNTTLPQTPKGRLDALEERTANRAVTANLLCASLGSQLCSTEQHNPQMGFALP